jgi:hypothetical protein
LINFSKNIHQSETIEPLSKPTIEPKNSNSGSLNLESPRSEYMTELKKIVSNEFKVQATIQKFNQILDDAGLETLEHWNKVTKEDKKLFPVGLKYLLDEKAGIEPENVRKTKTARGTNKRRLGTSNESIKEDTKESDIRNYIICFYNRLGDFFGIFNLERSEGPSEVLYSPLQHNNIDHGCSMDFLSTGSTSSQFLRKRKK